MMDREDEKTIDMFEDIDNDFVTNEFVNQYKNGIVDNDTELLLQAKLSQLLNINIKYMTVADNLKLAQSIKIYKDLLESHRKNQKE